MPLGKISLLVISLSLSLFLPLGTDDLAREMRDHRNLQRKLRREKLARAQMREKLRAATLDAIKNPKMQQVRLLAGDCQWSPDCERELTRVAYSFESFSHAMCKHWHTARAQIRDVFSILPHCVPSLILAFTSVFAPTGTLQLFYICTVMAQIGYAKKALSDVDSDGKPKRRRPGDSETLEAAQQRRREKKLNKKQVR